MGAGTDCYLIVDFKEVAALPGPKILSDCLFHRNIMCGLLHCEIHKSHENAAADHVYKVMGQDKVRFGSYKTPGKEETHICL